MTNVTIELPGLSEWFDTIEARHGDVEKELAYIRADLENCHAILGDIEHYLIFNSSGTVLFGSKNINWESVYDFIDRISPHSELAHVVNKYRDQLLSTPYDII